jgi:predicted CXXCH cytochrome family protein
MKRFLTLTSAASLWLISGAVSADTIVGSAHDFSAETWAGGEICVVCHTPHSAISNDGPIWNRASYTATGFTMYPSGGTIQGAIDTAPTGTSVLCLSCHDGTVAIDSFGGAAGTVFIGSINADALLDKDLSDDHPVSIVYSPGLDSELNATSTAVTFGNADTGTVQDLLDTGDKVQCSSCHDVHNTQSATGEPYLLRVDNTGASGSDLCLACHGK